MTVYLKSLELQGFKSFADKTVVQFGSDITAIVGPNGSGKSNISDAIRWVMGETSSKELRGTKMEDVIFGGTQKRSPLGFAEATLTLDNSDGAFKIDTPEVQITRRYYRSGESDYYVNRQSARLKDINELFMDTGLGRDGYSNIGQGHIDEIISRKSTERREVFEEAAGISKYRHRKEETERRLAGTEENLLRIGDKITELELQVVPLREQAEKAKKYLTLRDELKGLEVTVWLDSLDKLAANAKKAEEDFNSAAFILEQEHNALNELYSASDQYNLQLNRLNLAIEEKRAAISAVGSELQAKDGEASVLRANIQNNETNIVRIQSEMDDQSERSGGIEAQIRAQQERIEQIRAEHEKIAESLRTALDESANLSETDSGMERAGLQLRAKSALLQTEISGKKAEVSTITSSVGEVLERKKNIEIDLAAARERERETTTKADGSKKALSAARDDVTSAENTISGYELRRKTRIERRDTLQKTVDSLGIEERTTASRIQMFREMERDFEGFSKAVKIVMQDATHGKLHGVYGPVSSLIKTEDQYTVAIETALGAGMQNIVVGTDGDSKNVIQALRRCDGGRVTCLPLNMVQGRKLGEQGLSSCNGFVGVAEDLVSFDGKYKNAISFLLGRIVVAENLDSAIAMSKKYGKRFKIVTLDGQVMNAGGSMTGGSVSKSSGVLSRANELARLSKSMDELKKKIDQAERDLAEANRAANEVEFELSTVQTKLRQAEDQVLYLEGEGKQYELLLEALSANIAGYEKELTSIQNRSGSDETRLSVLRADIEKAEAALMETDRQLAAADHDRCTLAEQTRALAERITALKMEDAAGDAEREAAASNVARLETLAEAMRGDRTQKLELIAKYQEENRELAGKIEACEHEHEKLTQDGEAARAALAAVMEERNQIEALRTKTEKESQDKNKDIVQMEREYARLEQKKATTALEEKQIIDKLWDSYELTRVTAAAQAVEIESIAAANRRIGELKRKISALGTPNLGAIYEFARVNERYEYLTGQRDDVLHSKKELEEIVNTITAEMKDIFVREFGRINEYFSQTFVEMFGGGKASLELEDPAEPLSCGIEIRVQPPGKQLKTITLLSGGEKAFVAIALYFAILKVRPASFCLLDEIDAALDDRNVERFAAYLRNLSDKTQFIVITHRRGTMEASDVLYGVTMQEHGVSRILHIDLNQMEHQLGIVS